MYNSFSRRSTPIIQYILFISMIFIWTNFFYTSAWAKLTTNHSNIHFGATEILGPALEPCVTTDTLPGAIIVHPTDAWEETLLAMQPGTTLLFREGSYQANTKIWLPAGAPEQFITLKPYNCEQVTLSASLRPLSYTIIAGLTLEARAIADSDYVLRIDSEYKGDYWGNITQVVIRNNRIHGGLIDAVRISDHSTAITISGNEIDGGSTGHNIFVTAEKRIHLPEQIFITNNRLTKNLFDTPAEDMFQVRDVGYVAFTYNTCTDGGTMEQCIDLKTTTTPLLIANNFFDGDHLHLRNTGEDGSNGCMVIHESDEVADQHMIENNYFKRCKGAAIRFAAGQEGSEISSGIVRHNLFYQRSDSEGVITIAQAHDLIFTNNTLICGRLKLGNSEQTRLPSKLVLKNNIFYKTKIEDHTTLPAYPYTCAHNLLFAPLGSGFSVSGCTNSLETEPQFAAASTYNFQLLPTSPALNTGENGVDIGAFAAIPPAIDLAFSLYLPLVRQNTAISAEIMCNP